MGRQIRRVPLDFDWELNKIWKGFLCPYDNYSVRCSACDGTGYNPETKKLYDTWYDHNGAGVRWWYEFDNEGRACKTIEAYPGACKRWLDKLTQDEVDRLVEELRYAELTHDWLGVGKGWVPKNPPVKLTAEEVNAANAPGARGRGHDCCNQNLCVEVRAKRLGVYGKCQHCSGKGSIVTDPELKKLADEWEPESPPEGEGWQLWEHVSEGSPVTPVFSTAEELIDYLVDVGDGVKKYSREGVEAFIRNGGWACSAIGISGVGLLDGIEASVYLEKENGSDKG
jgi:hypothetical protein